MFSYDENGNLKGQIKIKPPAPTRLQWEFKEELVKNIDQAYQDALKIVQVSFIFFAYFVAESNNLKIP